MAIELCSNPSFKLDGQEKIYNRTTGEEMTVDDLQKALRDYYGDIQTMRLINSGMITLSLADYFMMPVTGREAIQIFRKVEDDAE